MGSITHLSSPRTNTLGMIGKLRSTTSKPRGMTNKPLGTTNKLLGTSSTLRGTTSMSPLRLSPRAAAQTYRLDHSRSVWWIMYVSHGYAFEPWLILLRQQTFIPRPDTSGISTSSTSSNQKFDKIQKISHPTAFSGTSARGTPTSFSRPTVGRKDRPRTPCRNNCGQTFALASDAIRHLNHSCLLSDNLTRAHCHICSKSFSRKDSLRRHVMWKHSWERGTF